MRYRWLVLPLLVGGVQWGVLLWGMFRSYGWWAGVAPVVLIAALAAVGVAMDLRRSQGSDRTSVQ